MSWRALTETDVETVLLGPELESFRSVAGAADGSEDDKLDAILATVTDECRAHIEDCATNRLGPAGTLPERVIHHALAIVRQRILSRIDIESSETRTREYKDAVAFFHRVSECKVKIEKPDPDEVVEEANTPKVETVVSSEPQMGKTQLGGLF